MVDLRNASRCQVGGLERLRDDDVRVGQLFVEDRVRTFFVGGYNQRVTLALKSV
jgi:hypothetical protein